MRYWPILGIFCLLALACTNATTKSGKDGARRHRDVSQFKKIKTKSDDKAGSGVIVAKLDAQSKETQVIEVPSDTAVGGTSIEFPPGSLAIDTTLNIEEAVPINSKSMAAQLELGSPVVSAGTAVSIQPSTATDALEPFTIALSLPQAAALHMAMNDPYANLLIIYKVMKAETNVVVAGVLPRSDLEVDGGKVRFKISHFGAYQAVLTSTLATTTAKEVVLPGADILVKREATPLPPLSISLRKPFVVAAGTTVTLNGVNFRPTMVLAVGGKAVRGAQVLSDSVVSFTAPSYDGYGLTSLTVEQDGVEQSVSLIYQGAKTDHPVYTGTAASLCKDVQFYDSEGVLRAGEKNCAPCSSDGQTDCSAVADFPAVALSSLATKVVSGQTVAGVAGTAAPEAHSNCTSDGETGCVTTTTFKAAAVAQVQTADLKTGKTIGGIVGALQDCASDGGTNCVASSAYAAAQTSGLAAKIMSGQVVAGVSGTATPEAHTTCTADGASGCVTASPYLAANTNNFSGTDIKSGRTIAGILGTLANCSSDGATSCVATVSYPAAKLAQYAASDVRSGITVAGIAGALGNCASDGASNCIAVAGYLAAKASNYAASDVRSGITIAGVAGTLAACASDGETSCITSGVLPAAAITGVSTWNLRYGQTLGGVVGALKTNCRNRIDTATYNHDGSIGTLVNTGTTAGTALDSWDTIDDYSGIGGSSVSGWSASTSCGSEAWTDVTTTDGGSTASACAAGTCIYKSQISNLKVTGILTTGNNTSDTASPSSMDWSTAVNACAGSTYGGYTAGAWRLPTQKELLSLYEHGIRAMVSSNFISASNAQGNFWSASSSAQNTGDAWRVGLASGATTTYGKGNTASVICVQ